MEGQCEGPFKGQLCEAVQGQLHLEVTKVEKKAKTSPSIDTFAKGLILLMKHLCFEVNALDLVFSVMFYSKTYLIFFLRICIYIRLQVFSL